MFLEVIKNKNNMQEFWESIELTNKDHYIPNNKCCYHLHNPIKINIKNVFP